MRVKCNTKRNWLMVSGSVLALATVLASQARGAAIEYDLDGGALQRSSEAMFPTQSPFGGNFSVSGSGNPGQAMVTLDPAYAWHERDGHWYTLTSTYSTWAAAEAEAVGIGGHLVTISDATENAWLVNTFPNARSSRGDSIAWIGYFRDADGRWSWVNGEPVTYTNHYYRFPQGGTRAYLHMAHHSSRGTWNANWEHDQKTAYQPMGIVEVIPEPTTLSLLALGGLVALGRRRR